MKMKVSYSILLKPKNILLTSAIFTLVIQFIVYLHPSNQGWWNNENFSWLNLLQFVFIDQILIECITVGILFSLIYGYTHLLRLYSVNLNFRGIAAYELSFLPIVLLAFFVFNPFTQTIRFLYLNLPNPDWNEYFSEYLFAKQLYFTYTPIIFLITYAVVNINLVTTYLKKKSHETPSSDNKLFIKVHSAFGDKLLDIEAIEYIERLGRKYAIQTSSGTYFITKTMNELEQELPDDMFVRINRSTLVRINEVDHYAYWENDKYTLKLKSGRDFVMSRQRLNKIKEQLNTIG